MVRVYLITEVNIVIVISLVGSILLVDWVYHSRWSRYLLGPALF